MSCVCPSLVLGLDSANSSPEKAASPSCDRGFSRLGTERLGPCVPLRLARECRAHPQSSSEGLGAPHADSIPDSSPALGNLPLFPVLRAKVLECSAGASFLPPSKSAFQTLRTGSACHHTHRNEGAGPSRTACGAAVPPTVPQSLLLLTLFSAGGSFIPLSPAPRSNRNA